MNNFHKFITVVLMLALVFSISACAESSYDDETETFATTETETDISDATETETETETVTESTDTESETETSADTDAIAKPDEIPGEVTVKYVALGDSIAYGYGLASIESERYPTLIADYISSLDGYRADVYNYAVNGDKTGDLIELIEGGGASELADADVVTLSIGANNVLGPALDKLSEYYIFASIEDENLRNLELPRIYNELISETQAGIQTLNDDIAHIIELIKTASPDAQIIFQTIYNPYRLLDITLDFAGNELVLADETDRLVTALNGIITENADSLGYDVIDVYTAFSELTDVVNADRFDGSDDDYATIFMSADPHPNANGHRVIADAIIPIIKLP